MSDAENIWDINQTRNYLKISRQLLYFYIKVGKLKPFIDIPRHKIFRKEDVVAFKKSIKI